MPISAQNVHRIAALQPGDNGRRSLCWVEGEAGAWIAEDRVEAFWRAGSWERFRQTRACLEAVASPFTSRVRDVESDSLTLESWVPGACLHDVAADGQLDVPVACRIASQVAGALLQIHAAGARCEHLSPWDVVLGPLGVARLTRVAKSPGIDLEGPQVTGRVGASHRIKHLSAEVLRGDAPTVAADVFGLGSTLYWMLEGVTPFSAGTPMAEMMRTLSEEPTPLSRSDVPAPVAALLGRMLRADPTARPSGAEVATVLSEASGGCWPPVLGWTVSAALERLRAMIGDGEYEEVAAVLTARADLAHETLIADYVVPQLLDDEGFDAARFAALSHYIHRPDVVARLEQWGSRDPREPQLDSPRRALVDLGPFVIEACDKSWDDLIPGSAPDTRHCDECGRGVVRVADGAAALEHAGACVQAEPSAPGFWDRLRRRLSRGQ